MKAVDSYQPLRATIFLNINPDLFLINGDPRRIGRRRVNLSLSKIMRTAPDGCIIPVSIEKLARQRLPVPTAPSNGVVPQTP